ncbi:hypothetical protein [Geodermatophilus sp. SYSU D00700]
MIAVVTYQARTALPYAHHERAAAGLRAQLRLRLPPAGTADWSTFTVTGPVETSDARGNVWHEYTAEVTAC